MGKTRTCCNRDGRKETVRDADHHVDTVLRHRLVDAVGCRPVFTALQPFGLVFYRPGRLDQVDELVLVGAVVCACDGIVSGFNNEKSWTDLYQIQCPHVLR